MTIDRAISELVGATTLGGLQMRFWSNRVYLRLPLPLPADFERRAAVRAA
jgi:hypothetical protein